ncbi:histone-lysine N-methyltransferase EHMT1 isoform X2 [Planococcus citri]|uniref:histone-lysine N-methyltransferase EHMT1 isoform X2 n=1 Tax=Planococcus citri TaxID=170843 RepID=UPI0031F80806
MEEDNANTQENDVNFLYNKSEETNGVESYEPYSTQDLEELLEDETPVNENTPDVAPIEKDILSENVEDETELTHENNDTNKPRIILTLRTSDTDPDAYFSTSSIQPKVTEESPEKKEVHKVRESLPDSVNVELSSKRTLRRMSNCKESVLQNAIALKEKSFGLPDTSYKKRSPKGLDKSQRSLRMKSPKSLMSYFHDKSKVHELPDNKEITITPIIEDDVDLNVNPAVNEPTLMKIEALSEIEINSNGSFNNSIQTDDSLQSSKSAYDKNLKPKRRKRYFKGLSYSFNNKRHPKKRRLQSERGRGNKYEPSESSEQDTDSQHTIINSSEINEMNDESELSKDSSQEQSVLFKSATGILQNHKHTSMDVINNSFNEKAPSPSTGDTPKKPSRPESTLISSGGGTAALCLCQVQEKVFMKVESDSKHHCQAIDSIEGKHIGCCNYVDIVEEDIKLQRPSVKVTYLMFCKVHTHRLLIHNCCPTCGLFCTQGKFVMCESHHMYHRKCELLIEDKRVCPHCGQLSPSNDVHISIGQKKNPVFLPFQISLRDTPSAKMSFRGSVTLEKPEDRPMSPPLVPPRIFTLPSGKEITSDGLPASIEKEKLEKYLLGLLPCSSSSPAQRCTYRMMYQASKAGDVEKIMACLSSGLNPNHLYREHVMGSALHAASAGGFIAIVHILTQAGSQLDLLDREQNTSLMLAALNGHNDVVKYLVKAGANVSFKGKDGMAALHLAAKSGNLEACYYLLSNPKSPRDYVNFVDDGGWTPLVWAAEFNHLDVALYLLSRGADPFVRDVEQNIALHWASFTGSVDTTEVLLNYNSDINCTNVHGDTPLHICARQDHYACVVLLLAHKARTDIVNKAGQLAVDCCVIKPSDSENAIRLNMQLKEMTSHSREKTARILTNDITRGHEVNPIQCINAIDMEDEPTDFVYITENCFTSNIKVDRTITSLKSCCCRDNCSSTFCSCGKLSLRCWYTDDGKLSPDFNYAEPPMLFECNAVCKCNKVTCKNRVVQHGITGRFQLFRTKEKGWGVSTLRLIPKGTYVCEYIGEIITDTEADTRQDDSYLFDLDNRDGETYCIDAFRYGNIARFINHSCVPNLLPVRVFIDHQDLHFPRIAFFANRDIQPYEELGFDYGEKFWIIKYKSFTCTCGAETCRYSTTTIQKTLDAYNKKLMLEES